MPPRKKRIRSDDSENSTVDSKGPSSGSDVQKPESLKNLRHQNKKINPEDYDGDCELERYDKNRVTRTATRSRVLKQKLSTNVRSDSSSSTPVTHMDVDDFFGFENLTTPVPCSPVPLLSLATPKGVSPLPGVRPTASTSAPLTSKPIFETPVEKPVKKYKRKRMARVRQQNNVKPTKQEESMLIHFHEVEGHELLIE